MNNTFIALLRAVNVVGRNTLSTKDLVRSLESAGLRNVKTYIQSGNAVFQADRSEATALAERISTHLGRSLGFAPKVLLLRLEELEAAMKSNPFAAADSDPKALHVTFLASAPKAPDLTLLESIRKDTEQYSLKGRVFYFWAPEGVGRSKLFSRVEKLLRVSGTARNWRTVCKLREMAREVAALEPRPKAEEKAAKMKRQQMTAEEFRRVALKLPGVVEAAHVDHPDFRVKGKIFASLGYPDECWAMVKLTPEQQGSFVAKAPEVFRPCSGAWGRRGCTNIHLASANRNLLSAALNAAFKNIAT